MRACWNCGFLVENVCKPLLLELFHMFSITIQSYIKETAKFVQSATWWKNDSSTLKNFLWNTNEHTCDYLFYVTLLICLRWSVVWFWRVIRKCILAWIYFSLHNKGIATKLTEKMGRDLLLVSCSVMLTRLLYNCV